MTDVTNDASDYDRAVVLAGAMGVRVVETTQDEIIERWGIKSSAVLVTRGKTRVRFALDVALGYDAMKPGEQRIYLAERRHGCTIAVLHELGHAALDHGWEHRRDRRTIALAEIEAWRWAMEHLDRPLTAAERQEITRVLMGYGARMKEIRTHVLLTNARPHGILSVPPNREAPQ